MLVAETDLATKAGELVSAQEELRILLNNQAALASRYEELLAAFNAQQKTRAADEIIQATVLNFTASDTSSSQLSVAANSTSLATDVSSGNSSLVSTNTVVSAGVLPATGTKDSNLALYGLSLAAGLGLAVPSLRKRRKNQS